VVSVRGTCEGGIGRIALSLEPGKRKQLLSKQINQLYALHLPAGCISSCAAGHPSSAPALGFATTALVQNQSSSPTSEPREPHSCTGVQISQ